MIIKIIKIDNKLFYYICKNIKNNNKKINKFQ